MYQFPQDDYDNPRKLLGLLGTFWSELYGGRDLILSRIAAKMRLSRQLDYTANEIVQLSHWHSAPLWQHEPWYAIRVTEQALRFSQHRYDDSVTYNEGAARYDQGYQVEWRVPVTPDLKRCCMITDGMQNASISWHPPIDFRIADGWIYLRENPFDAGFPSQDVYEDGQVVDREAYIWLFGVDWDSRYISDQYGYVVGLTAESSQTYRVFVANAMQAIAQGTSVTTMNNAIAAAFDVQLVAQPDEQVEAVISRPTYLQIATSENVYTLPANTTPTVSVGDILTQGQAMIAEFGVYPLQTGALPVLPEITVPASLLDATIKGPLTFENGLTSLTYTGTPGNERVRFDVGGDLSDIAAFWAETDARQTENTRLYLLLQQYYGGFPSTINPMEFLLQHLWRRNGVIVRVSESLRQDRDLAQIRVVLRRIQPPGSLILFVDDNGVIE